MSMETLLATFGKKVIQQVAESLSQQELKKHMSRKELEELLLPLVADLTDDDSEDQYEPIDVTKKECPPGISPQSALEILRICQRGVPKGSFVHVVKRKIMVPTEQQEGFYRDTKARIFGVGQRRRRSFNGSHKRLAASLTPNQRRSSQPSPRRGRRKRSKIYSSTCRRTCLAKRIAALRCFRRARSRSTMQRW